MKKKEKEDIKTNDDFRSHKFSFIAWLKILIFLMHCVILGLLLTLCLFFFFQEIRIHKALTNSWWDHFRRQDHCWLKGILKMFLVEVWSLEFRMDFIIIRMKNFNASLLFGRPFLAPSRAKIDVDEKTLELLTKEHFTR